MSEKRLVVCTSSSRVQWESPDKRFCNQIPKYLPVVNKGQVRLQSNIIYVYSSLLGGEGFCKHFSYVHFRQMSSKKINSSFQIDT